MNNSSRLSRISFRKHLKRERRRIRRQQKAKALAQKESDALALLKQDPAYLTRLADQEALELCRLEEERRISEENHRLWLEREQVAHFEFQKKRSKEVEAERKVQEQRDKIRREFEEAEAKRKLLKEQKQKAEEEILRNHQLKLQEIRDYIQGLIVDIPESLLGTTSTNPTAQECQYFRKTSVCRFGDRCTRKHVKSKLSSILLVHNFFRTENFLKGYSLTNAEEIIQNSLEVNREYNEFFADICGEFEKYGTINNLLVCSNSERHMIGNVLAEFSCPRSALAACYQLNGRFYGGQKLTIDFCQNLNWRTAVCGLSLNNKCSRGNTCNYLHIFRNPGNKYPLNMNTIQSVTPSPAVYSLNNDTVERKDQSWNEPENGFPFRKHWRWSASPEPKKAEVPKNADLSKTNGKSVVLIDGAKKRDSEQAEERNNSERKDSTERRKRESRSRSRSIKRTRTSRSASRDNPKRHKRSHKSKLKKRKKSRSRSKSRSRDISGRSKSKHKKRRDRS